jgi:hypothetical protein
VKAEARAEVLQRDLEVCEAKIATIEQKVKDAVGMAANAESKGNRTALELSSLKQEMFKVVCAFLFFFVEIQNNSEQVLCNADERRTDQHHQICWRGE